MLTKQSKVILNRRSASLTSVLLSAVASPNDSLGLPIRNDVLVSIVQEHLAAFRRLSKDQFFLTQLLTADNFLQNLRDVSDCEEEKSIISVLNL